MPMKYLDITYCAHRAESDSTFGRRFCCKLFGSDKLQDT